jgi:hypothetical protein
VGLIQDLENKLLLAIADFFRPVIDPLTKFWGVVKGFFTALIDVVPETIELVQLIMSEVSEWRDFRLSINIKGGVINLQSVKDRIQTLITELVTAWHSLVDLFTSGFKMPLKSIEEAQQAAEEVVTAFENFFGKFGLREALEKLGTTLKKAGGKVFEVLALRKRHLRWSGRFDQSLMLLKTFAKRSNPVPDFS